MKKETIIAIAFGIVLGLTLAVFLLTKNKQSQLQKNKAIQPIVSVTPAKMNPNTDEKILEITSPSEGTIVKSDSIQIKGMTQKGATVVIQSPIKDLVFKSDAESFTKDFPLATGENVIDITVYVINGQTRSQNKEIRVYYLDEQL